jgi:hypothetical protein
VTNLASFGNRLVPADGALVEQLDALAELDPERAARWSAFFAQSDAGPDVVLRALDGWLHLRRGLPAPGALSVPLFQLLVARWAYGDRCAFEEGERRLSFSELEMLTAGRAERWSAAGVGPKKVICLGRSLGVELLLDLLTVFRLGGCACWVPPLGEPFEKAALAAAQPDFVSGVDALSAATVPNATTLDGNTGFGGGLGARAVAAGYAAKDPCLLVFSTLQAGAEPSSLAPPSPIAAGQFLRALGRDAAFVWCLRPGDRMAAPGLGGQRHQPMLALAALLSGACFHFASTTSAAASAGGLYGSYRTVGLSAEAGEALLKKPSNAKCELWFRVLEESRSEREWRDWARVWGETALGQRVSFDPALGAVALLSPSESEHAGESGGFATADAPAYPPLGVEWALVPLPGAAPGERVGLLVLKTPHSAAPYLLVRSRAMGGVFYWAAQGTRRAGQVFPRGITCAAVTPLPGVLGATVVTVPGDGAVAPWRFGLLVFVAASAGVWDERRAQAVEASLTSHVGRVLASEIRPDFVQVFPLQPLRGPDGAVDQDWATAERWSGGLTKRAKLDVFRHLAFVDRTRSE